MSLAVTPIGLTPLFGQDEVSLPGNAYVKFTHPSAPSDPLYVHSGATAITWAYTLNTQSTPTIGGEVVQILSALVGPISIKGQTAGLKTNLSPLLNPNVEVPGWQQQESYDAQLSTLVTKPNYSPYSELEAILLWFRKYMTRAGTQSAGNFYRDERAIEFQYPERGWKFYIQVTKLDGFKLDTKVIAPEWAITAEIVSDNALDYFGGATMASFTDDLITNQTLIGQIGLSAFASSTTETDNPNFGQTGDYGSTNPFLNPQIEPAGDDAATIAGKMSDNFQSLLAAYNDSNFANFGFGALLDNGQKAVEPDVNSVYQRLFGTTYLGQFTQGTPNQTTGSGSLTSSSGTFTYTGSNGANNIAAQIANAWVKAGMPPELGVAVAIHESNLNPDDRNPNDGGPGIDGVGLFQAHNPGGADPSEACRLASSVDRTDPPTKNYPVDVQINNASVWFRNDKPSSVTATSNLSNDDLARWAYSAQRGTGYTNDDSTTGSCTTLFASQIKSAKTLLGQLSQTADVSMYLNPLRGIQGLTPERIDQGVDYSGSGPIFAIGNGKITYYSPMSASSSIEWPRPGSNFGGAFLGYTLSDGPAAGLTVYIAENITLNPNLYVGMTVNPNTALGTLNNAFPNMEMGWAQQGTDLPLAAGVGANAGASAPSSIYGVNMSNLLKALGAPPGIQYGTPPDKLPSGWPSF